MKIRTLAFLPVALLLLAGCGGKSTTVTDTVINPRDTVQVPDYLSGEDSIAYIEDVVVQSPLSTENLLGLAEVHWLDNRFNSYYNSFLELGFPEDSTRYPATHRDTAALRLANRFLRMYDLVDRNGNGSDKLHWAMAVNVALDTFRVAVPSLAPDSALDEIHHVIWRLPQQTQGDINDVVWMASTLDYYKTIESYRLWLMEAPASIKALTQKEYEAWHDLNEARFLFWANVSYKRSPYSMKPMEKAAYYGTLAENRKAELEVERDIILKGKPYVQQGQTVTTQQWEEWIAAKSVPEDYEDVKGTGWEDLLPSDSLVACRVDGVRTTFTRWLTARQAIAAALPEEQGKSYDNMTADIHSRLIGKLNWIVPFDPY